MCRKFTSVIFLMVVFFMTCLNTYAQPETEWISRFNGPGNSFDVAANTEVDEIGNVYVFGSSNSNITLFDFAIVKYNSSGNEIWTVEFNGNGNSSDQIFKGTIDASGNSYVTGFITDSIGRNVITTAKYDSSGNLSWMKFFRDENYANGFGQDIDIDGSGNIVVCGFIRNLSGNYDIVTLKYSPSGKQSGFVFYNGSANGDDLAVTIDADNQNNIIVTGNSKENSGGADLLIIKYDPSLNFIWKKNFDGGTDNEDKTSSALVDENNAVYISGSLYKASSKYDYFYAKVSSDGNVEWQGTFNGLGNYLDLSYAIAKDNSGNIFITGLSFHGTVTRTEDILTLKISPEGELLWNAVFNGQADGTDQGIDLATDSFGNVYVGGGSDKGNVHLIYALLKYDPSGNQQWLKTYDNLSLSEDFISSVKIDNKNNIIVSGISIGETTNFDIVTIKYSQTTGILNSSNTNLSGYSLSQNYPNPFNPFTVINYFIPPSESAKVEFSIYDNSGKLVKYIDEGVKYSGNYDLLIDGSELSSGIYYYKISASGSKRDFVNVKKMILLK